MIDGFNIAAFSIAFGWTVSAFYKSRRRFNKIRIILLTTGIEAAFVFFHLQSFSMLFVTLATALFIYSESKNLLPAFLIAATSMLCIAFCVTFLGTILLLMGLQNQSAIFNAVMGSSLIGASITVYWLLEQKKLYSLFSPNRFQQTSRMSRISIFFALLKMGIIIVISFILPLVLLLNRGETLKHLFYMLLSVSLLLLFFSFYIIESITEKNNRLEREKLTDKIIREKHGEIVRLHHYYHKLYKLMAPLIEREDLDGLRTFFTKYIKPFSEKTLLANEKSVSKIDSLLLRNLFIDMLETADRLSITVLNFEVHTVYDKWTVKEIDDFTLFQILNIFIENALDDLKKQETGYLNVFILQDAKLSEIKIENTVSEDVAVSKINTMGYTTKGKHGFGQGLPIALGMISAYSQIEHFTYKKENLLVQHLIIHRSK